MILAKVIYFIMSHQACGTFFMLGIEVLIFLKIYKSIAND